MTARIHYDRRYQTVRSGTAFQFDFAPSSGAVPGVVHYSDLLVRAMQERVWYVPTGSRSIGRYIGFVGSQQSDHELKLSVAPYGSNTVDEKYDSDYYGSFFRNLQLFDSFLTGRAYNIPSHAKEKFVRHSTFSGDLVAKQVDIPLYSDESEVFGDKLYRLNTTRGYLTYGFTVNSVEPFVFTPITTYYGNALVWNFIDLLDILAKGPTRSFSSASPYIHDRVMSGLEYVLSKERLIVKYSMSSRNVSLGDVTTWDSELVIPFVDPEPTIQPLAGTTYYPDWSYPVIFRYRNGYITGYGGDPGASSGEYVGSGPNRTFSIMLSTPSPAGLAEEKDFVNVQLMLNNGRFLEQFRKDVYEHWFDVTSSALFSTVDAFKAAEGSLNTNVLQNLAKIPSISNALPQITAAVKVLGRLAKRDLSFATLRDIMNLASSTTLQASFEWRPYIGIVNEYLPTMLSTMHSLGLKPGNAIGYGSFSAKLMNKLGRKEVTLKTRTKIVMDASPSGLLSAALGFDALGLLPKASNIWDLIPFTFVVNWFTGVGEGIRRAEYSLLLATIPAYYVHTYTLSSPLSVDELDLLKMSSSSLEAASLRLFHRDVSSYTPAPRDSQLGFGLPRELPPLGVLGALLYQLIFA